MAFAVGFWDLGVEVVLHKVIGSACALDMEGSGTGLVGALDAAALLLLFAQVTLLMLTLKGLAYYAHKLKPFRVNL